MQSVCVKVGRFILPIKLRSLLKEPLGELIIGQEEIIIARIKEIIEKKKPNKIITIGDNVSRLFSINQIRTDLKIIDNREKRKPVLKHHYEEKHIFKVFNPAGVIEELVWPVIAEAIKKGNSLLIVEGEEDLLTLPTLYLSPKNSLIVYGQPNQGAVAVIKTKLIKEKIENILKMMILNNK